MLHRLARTLAALALLAFAPVAPAQQPVPVPQLVARVTDTAGLLNPAQRASLEEKLAAFESRKGSQIAVLVVPTTQPETIEQFALRVAEQWKLGRKGVDDGALLVVARDDRALRIEVGYGLEGALSDIVANRIVEDVIVPRFRVGDFGGGIDSGVDAMIKVVDGEPLPEPSRWTSAPGTASDALPTLFFVVIGAIVVGSALRAMFGRFPGATLAGAGAGFLGWLLLGSLGVALIAALVPFLFTLLGGMPAGRRGGWGGGFPGGGFPSGGGGWTTGGGGWGGGGGGFGGGGASGNW